MKSAEALRSLSTMGLQQVAETIKQAFLVAKRKVMLRFEQGTSYYSTFPWSIVKLLGPVVVPAGPSRQQAERDSRTFASELCELFDKGQLSAASGTFASQFFEGDLLTALRSWGKDSASLGAPMADALFQLLLAYGLALVSMQRLEGRHHLVNLRMSASRASAAATVSAALRRRQNGDAHHPTFRAEFEDHLQSLDLLVPEAWDSAAELHRLVSGHHLSIMFQDLGVDDPMTHLGSRAVRLKGFRSNGNDARRFRTDYLLLQASVFAALRSYMQLLLPSFSPPI